MATAITPSTIHGFPNLSAVAAAVLREWPQHEAYMQHSFRPTEDGFLTRLEDVAANVLALAGPDLSEFASAYHWMCDVFRDEQFHFARHKRYRRSTLEEAIRDVYGNAPYMSRYLKGILISQILWRNHAEAMDFYRTKFLPGNRNGYKHLEIGPGHGLFLVFAARDPRCAEVTGWDVSRSSIATTLSALKKMNVTRPVTMEEAEICSVVVRGEQFDSIICSEVLEHTEQPEKALKNIYAALLPGGRVFLNIPVNSPAPDHIYLWRSPEEVRTLVESQGFQIEQFTALPPTGKTLEESKRYALDISCLIIARKP